MDNYDIEDENITEKFIYHLRWAIHHNDVDYFLELFTSNCFPEKTLSEKYDEAACVLCMGQKNFKFLEYLILNTDIQKEDFESWLNIFTLPSIEKNDIDRLFDLKSYYTSLDKNELKEKKAKI